LNVTEKLAILADAAKYDASCASSGSKSTRAGSRLGTTEGMGICHSYTPDGRCVSLLKVLLTNYCIYDCQYCVNRISSDTPRARFTVAEVVQLTIEFYKRNYIEGLFLSSGIIQNSDYTMQQMIVGATDTADLEILKTASNLYTGQRLRRVYYSAYSPIPHADARLPGKSPSLVREHRLYQADWLLRFYGFTADEIVAEADQNLSLEIDPKTAWALANRHRFPVDVNTADREVLLRVPGFGLRNVARIMQVRVHQRLGVADLRRLRVAWNRAAPFVIAADHNPALRVLDSQNLRQRLQPSASQLMLFDVGASARTGEL
jgi:predicted DNA-binding helix-hairpin-helix protein